MNRDLAKSILQAILARTEGQVGSFADFRELTAESPFGTVDADTTVQELLARRWMCRKSDYVSVTKPGVEFAIDWTLADRVLNAIASIAGSQVGRVVRYSEMIAMAGLPTNKGDELMAELTVLGLAAQTTSDRKRIDGVYISRDGLSRLAGRSAELR